MRLLLVRHGQTSLNAEGLIRGQIDVALDPVGEAEAAAIGDVFRHVPVAAVVSSPLKRALDTARSVSSASSAPLRVEGRLSDRFYGEWAGKALTEVQSQFGSIDAAPGVESRESFESRVRAALVDELASRPLDAGDVGAVVLVTHDAVLHALLQYLVPSLSTAQLELPTGSWCELDKSSETDPWRAVHLGEVPGTGRPARD